MVSQCYLPPNRGNFPPLPLPSPGQLKLVLGLAIRRDASLSFDLVDLDCFLNRAPVIFSNNLNKQMLLNTSNFWYTESTKIPQCLYV